MANKSLKHIDWALASFHECLFPPADRSIHTAALESILYNPYVNAFGHLGNPNFDFDHEYIISRCNERGKVVEINNASLNVRAGSKKNCADIARLCMKYEVPIVVDSDSHICFRVGHVEGALEMLEEIGFPEELIINSSMARLDAYFKGPRHGSVQRRRIRGILMRIGIDLGGTSVKAALCADDGAILIKQSVPTKTGDPDGLRADMKQLALALCASGGVQPDEVESIGIGVPGSWRQAPPARSDSARTSA